jgi:hypothetical protein
MTARRDELARARAEDVALALDRVLEELATGMPPFIKGDGSVGSDPDREQAHRINAAYDRQLDRELDRDWKGPSNNRYDRVRNGKDHNASRRRCDNGHEFTPENTYYAQMSRAAGLAVSAIGFKVGGTCAQKERRQTRRTNRKESNDIHLRIAE